MGFWQNVDNELKFQCRQRKELASSASFDVSYIGKGIRRNSIPAADLALRIAKSLNVSLEFLLDMPETDNSAPIDTQNETNTALRLYHKYSDFAAELETLSPSEQEVFLNLLRVMNSAHTAKNQ